ncbi:MULTISPECIES: SPOR domain-containing protein [Stutzerimonas]|uniref:SPOR domain-containing protein n=1 Tax=Stutzerimonas balearica TaxID=74829 RepID=A0A9X7YSK2_9GAMM|nr:SPOR domain-containing protein [Stutzerimonas balearica]MBZ5754866.1 SPOR domain-containing protein [Pseudomonas sp. S5(2021)]HAV87168.1 cell division protein [Pseudomonas sp.]MBK3746829.1 SPOR domain-containing protein [Stutzerimonas balearica]MBK3825026.1 SPOR domain-containing protein [Stutzerimonas balearica]MBK3854717.1 SPOR domain-containing protein [Stutzerimonas balearica]
MAARKKAAPKRGASRYQAPAKKNVPGWVWLVCGLAIGGFLVFLATLEPGGDEIKRTKEPPQAKQQAKPKPQGEQPPKPKYDFYTLLPESEVILPPETKEPEAPAKAVTPEQAAKLDEERALAALSGQVPPPPPTVAKAPVTQFFLQAGSFRKQVEADKVRAQIILLGQDVRVERVTVREEPWFRVLVGPFTTREQLNLAQKTLAGSGYKNLLLQQRQVR